jgi:hypothetical protein
MKAKARTRIRAALPACVMLATLAFAPYASADVVRILFNGTWGSGYADLTLEAPAPGDVIDPAKSPMAITGASGAFGGAAIIGVRPLDPAPVPPQEDPAKLPDSYSLFSIPGYGDHDGLSYDNLFYGNGSPAICYLLDGSLEYPFAGGLFDLMGVMFALDDGSFIDLWSFGDTAPDFFGPGWPGGLAYGMSVIQPTDDGGYEVLPGPPFATASIPEPNVLWLFGAGGLGLLAWRRPVEKKAKRRVG